jgi:hypothetical protein
LPKSDDQRSQKSLRSSLVETMNQEFSDHLLNIERGLWTNDAVFYRDHLTEDCLLVFPETGVITRDIAVDAIRKENEEGRRWAEVYFDEVHSLRLAEDVALLTYRAIARWQHEKSTITALASSLYVKRDGAWKLAFHQQTPTTGGSQDSPQRTSQQQESDNVEQSNARRQSRCDPASGSGP